MIISYQKFSLCLIIHFQIVSQISYLVNPFKQHITLADTLEESVPIRNYRSCRRIVSFRETGKRFMLECSNHLITCHLVQATTRYVTLRQIGITRIKIISHRIFISISILVSSCFIRNNVQIVTRTISN